MRMGLTTPLIMIILQIKTTGTIIQKVIPDIHPGTIENIRHIKTMGIIIPMIIPGTISIW